MRIRHAFDYTVAHAELMESTSKSSAHYLRAISSISVYSMRVLTWKFVISSGGMADVATRGV